jgi:hypothetical protein
LFKLRGYASFGILLQPWEVTALSNKRRRVARIVRACSAVVGLTLTTPWLAAVNGKTWTGLGASDNWSDANNWTPAGAPPNVNSFTPAKASVHFDGSTRLTPAQNFVTGFNLFEIIYEVGAGPFVISGSPIGFGSNQTGYIINNSAAPQIIHNEIVTAFLDTYFGTPFLGSTPITPGTSLTLDKVSGTGVVLVSPAKNGLVTMNTATYTGTTTVQAGQLTLAVDAWGPVLTGPGGADVKRGVLAFNYSNSTTPAATVQAILANGYASNFSTGQIRDSAATSSIGLGWNDDGTSNVKVAATYYGDADLNGTVDSADFNVLAANFSRAGNWSQADFDYNGVVDTIDVNLLESNFGKPSVLGLADGGSFGTLAPEPLSAALATLAAGTVALRRR